MRLLLVRYGEWENGHLTGSGVESMRVLGSKLLAILGNKPFLVISADVPRAVESATILAISMGVGFSGAYRELYAADEDDLKPDCGVAVRLISRLSERNKTVVAVVSREYIETLPSFILGVHIPASLKRGQALVVDTESKELTYIE